MTAKRALDLLFAGAGLAVAAPVLLVIAAAMRMSGDPGPLIHRARRVGEGGRPFTILKIRTMFVDAGGSGITGRNDPRVTPVGRVLRRYRLDELPQLLNVVRGEMSLVGPRPEDPIYVDMADPLHRRVFSARPGITGLAQLEFHDEAELLGDVDDDLDRRYREVVLPRKLRIDSRYVDQRSMRLDAAILLRTLAVVVGGRRTGTPGAT